MMVQVARALSALHGHGLVHRDMKPGNLIMGDGGVYRHGPRHYQADRRCLRRDQRCDDRDPRYMPPEMFSNGLVDGRADLYSLGIVAYRALGGVVPFDGPTPMAILYKQAHTEPEPLRSLNPDVSRSMATVFVGYS